MSVFGRFLDPILVERLQQLQLSARRVVEGTTTGRHRSPVKGASVEFRQHRFYVPGDEPRRLDWRVLGRTDRPYVKEYDEETNLRCLILLDCSGSMKYGKLGATKFDYAAGVVAALAFLMLGQTESMGMAPFSEKLGQFIAPHAGTSQLTRILESLDRLTPSGTSDPERAMRESADRLGRRALVIVVSDFLAPVDSLRKGLARLQHDRHEVILLRILHRDEVEFPFRRWSRFRGMEGESPRICEPGAMKEIYLENFNRHCKDLEDSSRALRVEIHSFITDMPLGDAITGFLKRRVGGR
jgi:uncharacterized protein (DUF58 family)